MTEPIESQWTLCCGEALFDVTTADARTLHAQLGGGPANTALAVAKAGLPAALWAGRSASVYGERLVDTLTASGVFTGYMVSTPAAPTMSLASRRGTSVSYEIFAEGTSSFDVVEQDAPLRAPDGRPFGVIHVGGLGTAVKPMADVLRSVAPRWTETGAIVGYDPNIRDGFEARGQSLREVEEWFALSTVVKVSMEDVEALYGDTAVDEVAARILSLGAKLVIATDGPRPVTAFAGSYAVVAPVLEWPAEVLPIGAGDSFIAGVYAALLRAPETLNDPDEAALAELLGSGLRFVADHADRLMAARI